MLIVLEVLFILSSIFMIFFILVQPARGEGIAGAFSGIGTDTFFGTKVGQHMSKATVVLAVMILLLAFAINIMLTRKAKEDSKPAAPIPASEPAKK